jgi:hypothetical protein
MHDFLLIIFRNGLPQHYLRASMVFAPQNREQILQRVDSLESASGAARRF